MLLCKYQPPENQQFFQYYAYSRVFDLTDTSEENFVFYFRGENLRMKIRSTYFLAICHYDYSVN